MTEPRGVSYADRARHAAVTVDENVRIGRDTYRVRFGCPEIAAAVLPGQFVMIRLAARNDPLLGRPFAVYDALLHPDGRPWGLDVVYLAVGRMTRRLAELAPGDRLDVWGPLGNGFPPERAEHLVMVAGGIGQTPLLALGQEYLGTRRYGDPPRDVPRAGKVTLCYGARGAEYFAGVEDFRAAGIDVHLSTDDGSLGHHGPVTELIAPVVEAGKGTGPVCRDGPKGALHKRDRPPSSGCRIVCCGPEPMMEAVAAIAQRLGVPCRVSLETPMACGLGICFSCVAKIRDASGQWDYRRTCVEGPVFDAEDVDFS